MLLYEVQLQIPEAIFPEWQRWMESVHIPDVLATGCFAGFMMAESLDAAEGFRACTIWYALPSPAAWKRYQQEFAPALQQDHRQRFPQVQASRRMLRVVAGTIQWNDAGE